MGEILGYPCFREFNETPLFSIHVNVHTDGIVELFANGSTSDSIEAFQAFAEKATPVLKSHFKSFQRIEIAVYPIVPTQTLIDHMLQGKDLTPSENDQLQNVLVKYGFSILRHGPRPIPQSGASGHFVVSVGPRKKRYLVPFLSLATISKATIPSGCIDSSVGSRFNLSL
jgi:hypothetical protein